MIVIGNLKVMAQSARNPKELRQMISESSLAMEEMQGNLGKLRALSEDDKTDNAKLRSRIDEQCQLIMILKQKADDGTIKIQTLEKINKELLEFRDEADTMLKSEIQKFNLLDGRFNTLAANHEEMIRIKDEYKCMNEKFKLETATLREENSQLFSKTVIEKDNKIRELDKKCAALQEQFSLTEQTFRQLQVEWRNKEDTNRKHFSELQASTSQQLKNLHTKLHDTEERLKGEEHKCKMQVDSKRVMKDKIHEQLTQLTKEKEELVDLAMQRGMLLQKEQDENKMLKTKIEELEKTVKNMEEKFVREADAVNANVRVKRLSEKLEDSDNKYSQMVKEFEAFQKHSNDLLKREKELNDRLRHLYA